MLYILRSVGVSVPGLMFRGSSVALLRVKTSGLADPKIVRPFSIEPLQSVENLK